MERGVQTGAHIGQEERRTCMAAIEVRHLYKRFEQKGVTVEALSDINLTVEQGDIYGIIGMSVPKRKRWVSRVLPLTS